MSAFLIVSADGSILLDGGLPETAPQIAGNIAALGFRLDDVKYLLNSHAHFDHAGELSELKRRSGAQMVASSGDAPALMAGLFRDVSEEIDGGFTEPRVGRGLAYGDFDRDGDIDLLMTTNNGPAVLFRNDQAAGNRSLRVCLVGTESNRDAIGATVRVTHGGITQARVVRSGSSYLSQSELPVTFGVGRRDVVDRVVIVWPSGRTDEFTNVTTGRAYVCVEGQKLVEDRRSA